MNRKRRTRRTWEDYYKVKKHPVDYLRVTLTKPIDCYFDYYEWKNNQLKGIV